MAGVLHLFTRGDASLARPLIERQRAQSDTTVTVVLLPGATVPPLPDGLRITRVPDELSYPELLELIFESDQVIAW
jgi:hypothetical protein